MAKGPLVKNLLLIIMGILAFELHAQTNYLDTLSKSERKEFHSIQKFVNETSATKLYDIHELAPHLTERYDHDLMKVRAIFLWITKNIKYNMTAFLKNDLKGQGIEHVMQTRLAICEGFSNLFSALCNQVGIENKKLVGYSKGYGYRPGQRFIVSNHSWNSVKIEQEWYLVDASWSSESTSSKTIGKEYFLIAPNEFLKDHLPEDPTWQLLETPISLEDFEKGRQTKSRKQKRIVLKDLDELTKEIRRYQRIVQHNPGNQDAILRLGYAYLSKALDTMDVIHSYRPEKEQLIQMDKLEQRFFGLLNKAQTQFEQVNEHQFETINSLKAEVVYQKGVFKYELGYQLLSSLYDLDKENFDKLHPIFTPAINKYWDEAIQYFKKTPPTSLYHRASQNYIHNSIPENRPSALFILK